jgi:RNA polymerase sigma-70 factor (ECF subfamily)
MRKVQTTCILVVRYLGSQCDDTRVMSQPKQWEASIRGSMSVRPDIDDSDHALMQRLSAGDEKSFETLVERYWSRLGNYAKEIVGDRDDAKDVVQEVFTRVWLKRCEWEPCGSVSAYFYRITRNLSLNARRAGRARSQAETRAGLLLIRSGSDEDPLRELETHRLRRSVAAALEKLPERRREAFVLSRFHGLTYSEIAETMGISLPTVANQISAALTQLRALLSDRLGVEEP